MGKIRTLLVTAAAVACPLLAQSDNSAGELIRSAAVISAGTPITFSFSEKAVKTETLVETAEPALFEEESAEPSINPAQTEEPPLPPVAETVEAQTAEPEHTTAVDSVSEGVPAGVLISRNISTFTDGDLETGTAETGSIIREYFGKSQSPEYITLKSGAQVRNMTELENGELSAAACEKPNITIELGSSQPQVLIMHTHTTESYEPIKRDWYDASVSSRTRDSSKNVVAVGETLARELAARGISVLHDGTIHDYPAYSGAYDRSEETIRAALEEYPSIKVIIDLHRDAIENSDGSRVAPTVQINGKSAAQFMIITGCDDGRFGNMPNYMENFRLACLIQNSAEELYEGLARPVLFDYRNYNQHISTGSLLIEVGGHANSFDEAEYTGELLGEILANALCQLQ